MREDAVVEVIRYDEAVIQYGNHLCRKYTSEHHAAQVRAQLRAFGKLILTAKEIDSSVSNMYDLLDARNVPLIIEAINKIAGLDSKTGLYRAPATDTSLGTELKRICKLLQMEFIKTNDRENLKRMKNLMTVFEVEFNVTINKKGVESQKIIKRRKKTILPKTEVIGQFRNFLESKIGFYIGQLEREYSKADWIKLAEYTLVHLAVFNRKRPGETQRILIEDYKHYEVLEENEMENEDLISKEQSKKWARIKFTGKLGNDNALLVHRDLGFKAINLILKYREEAGVDKSNRYIFGEPSQYHAQKTFQACSLIRKLSEESGIPNSELMRTRLLRQHLATETASHNIDSKLENRLSDFMAHNRKIHDVHYVLTKKKDDIMKVSTLLENFSSTKNLPSTSCNSENMAENNRLSNSEPTTSNVEEESNYELSSCSDSENEEENLSQAEINLILGK
ncbi:uncharacterized protein LOC123312064 [Coccinella septempunctata]|uniref:uncharacterized protein LOC123312064 n=1 Tax=Coccinella septempunctata TaxID=41139 RepID=UPI001D0606A6|nr:uncharacterized protein LOC123312064 [Coccinella septempunctata]XP_044752194.1 uncharacterized protein LOC123312064 [Coccinella septempunctata]